MKESKIFSFSMFCPSPEAFEKYLLPCLRELNISWDHGVEFSLTNTHVFIDFQSGEYSFVTGGSTVPEHVHIAGFDHKLFIAIIHSRGNDIYEGDYVKSLIQSDTVNINQIYKVFSVNSPVIVTETGEKLNKYSEICTPTIPEIVEYYTVLRSRPLAPYDLKSGDEVWMWDNSFEDEEGEPKRGVRGFYGGQASNGKHICWLEWSSKSKRGEITTKVVSNVLPVNQKLVITQELALQCYSKFSGIPVENLLLDI